MAAGFGGLLMFGLHCLEIRRLPETKLTDLVVIFALSFLFVVASLVILVGSGVGTALFLTALFGLRRSPAASAAATPLLRRYVVSLTMTLLQTIAVAFSLFYVPTAFAGTMAILLSAVIGLTLGLGSRETWTLAPRLRANADGRLRWEFWLQIVAGIMVWTTVSTVLLYTPADLALSNDDQAQRILLPGLGLCFILFLNVSVERWTYEPTMTSGLQLAAVLLVVSVIFVAFTTHRMAYRAFALGYIPCEPAGVFVARTAAEDAESLDPLPVQESSGEWLRLNGRCEILSRIGDKWVVEVQSEGKPPQRFVIPRDQIRYHERQDVFTRLLRNF